MDQKEPELKATLKHLAAEIERPRPLTRAARSRAVLRRAVTASLAGVAAAALIFGGVAVANRMSHHPTRVGGPTETATEEPSPAGDAPGDFSPKGAPVAGGRMDDGTYWKYSAYFDGGDLCLEMFLEFPPDNRGYPYGNCTPYPRSNVIELEVARDSTGQPILYGSITGLAGNLTLETELDGVSSQEPVEIYNAPKSVDAEVRFFAIPSAPSNSVAVVAYSDGNEIDRISIDQSDVGPQPWRDPTPASFDVIQDSTVDGQHYEVKLWKFNDQTCIEMEFDRSEDSSPAMCTGPPGHDLYYTEARVPGTNRVVVFGAVSKGVASLMIQPEEGSPVDVPIQSTDDEDFNYFERFFDAGNAHTISGSIAAFDGSGVAMDEGPLCSRHVWDEDGGSLCE